MLGNYADPAVFLTTLGRVLSQRTDLRSRVRVRFVGKKRPQTRRRLRDFPFDGIVHDIDHVPPSVATRLMRESDAVLLFHSADFERYIPGKLYEYAASGTPILLFDDCGESTRIVQGLGLGQSLSSNDATGLESALDSLVAARTRPRHSADSASATALASWLTEHTRQSLARRFFNLVGSRLALSSTSQG
jgi:glycosyltransferase involved in cell wall biosynthesis